MWLLCGGHRNHCHCFQPVGGQGWSSDRNWARLVSQRFFLGCVAFFHCFYVSLFPCFYLCTSSILFLVLQSTPVWVTNSSAPQKWCQGFWLCDRVSRAVFWGTGLQPLGVTPVAAVFGVSHVAGCLSLVGTTDFWKWLIADPFLLQPFPPTVLSRFYRLLLVPTHQPMFRSLSLLRGVLNLYLPRPPLKLLGSQQWDFSFSLLYSSLQLPPSMPSVTLSPFL